MTNQEVLNKIWNYFLVENNRPGWDFDSGSCNYLTPEGGKCAVGCLFSDEELKLILDTDRNRNDLPTLFKFLGKENFPSLQGISEEFLKEIQLCHDAAAEYNLDDIEDCDNFRDSFEQRVRTLISKSSTLYNIEVPA